jgi:hypothetical protein
MKRYDPSLSDFPEQARLQLQPVIPEPPRARGVHAAKVPGATDRLFAIREALLDEECAAHERQSNVAPN